MKPHCSKCGKRIWFWQIRWALSNYNENPHDYWHLKCARPSHELCTNNIDELNSYMDSIINFSFDYERKLQ